MLEFLSGKKTYIGLVVSFVLAALAALGYLDANSELFQVIIAAVLMFTGVAYREAIGKSGPTE